MLKKLPFAKFFVWLDEVEIEREGTNTSIFVSLVLAKLHSCQVSNPI